MGDGGFEGNPLSSGRTVVYQTKAFQTGRDASSARNLMGWTPPDGIDVPKWRC
jgi:hypothetical protein